MPQTADSVAPQPSAAALPCVIDIEASGFGRGSFPNEVGFILPDGQSYCSLVRPPAHWTHWDPRAEQVHGLTRAMLERHGRSPAEIAAVLNDRLRGATLYCDGWAHDYPWLALLFDEAGRTPAFKLRHLQELLGEDQARHWDAACAAARLGLALGRHRASSDARVLQQAIGHVRALAASSPARAGRTSG